MEFCTGLDFWLLPYLLFWTGLTFWVTEIREKDSCFLFFRKKNYKSYILSSASGPITHDNFSRCFPTEQIEITPLLCRLQSSHLSIVEKKEKFHCRTGGQNNNVEETYMLLTKREDINRMQVGDEQELFLSLSN